jgi:hypothetical protein
MLVQPEQFFGIELGGRRGYARQVKPGNKLLAGKYLIITVRPAKPRQIVDDRFPSGIFGVYTENMTVGRQDFINGMAIFAYVSAQGV